MDYLSVIDPFVFQVQSETQLKISKVGRVSVIYVFLPASYCVGQSFVYVHQTEAVIVSLSYAVMLSIGDDESHENMSNGQQNCAKKTKVAFQMGQESVLGDES